MFEGLNNEIGFVLAIELSTTLYWKSVAIELNSLLGWLEEKYAASCCLTSAVSGCTFPPLWSPSDPQSQPPIHAKLVQ